MKPADRSATIASLLLVGSVVFLASGAAAWFLRSEHRADRRAPTTGGERSDAVAAAEAANVVSSTSRDGVTPARTAERMESLPENGPELVIEGRVVDAGGQPIDGATVSLELRLDARPPELGESDPPSVRTAADGRFAFLGDAPSRSEVWIALVAHAAGLAPQLVQRAAESGVNVVDLGDVALPAGGSVAGRITDALGNPVAGATALLKPASGNPLNLWPPSSSDPSDLLKPAPADAAGRYEFANLMAGAYRVTATAPGMQEGSLREAALVEEGRDIEVGPIRLVPGVALSGSVLAPDDAPIRGAKVHVRSNSSGGRLDRKVASDADGRFHLEHLPAGPLQVDARAAGFSAAPRVEVDPAVSREVVLHLVPGLVVRGVVVDAGSHAPVERFAATLREIGRAELAASSAATRVLRRRIQKLHDEAGAAEDPLARAKLERAAFELEGRLSTLGASPVAASPRRAPAAAPLVDHPGGRFECSGLDEGSYAVEIATADHQCRSVAPVEVRRDAPVAELHIEVERGIAVRGEVVAQGDGTPLADATVDLVALDDDVSAAPAGGGRDATASPFAWAFAPPGAHGVVVLSAKSDGRGRFEMRQAPPGRYLLSASHEQACRQRTESFDLKSDRSDFRIALAPVASLHGRVRGIPTGLEREVAILAVGGFGTMRTVQVDADGAYRIERLQPGSYVVRAALADGDEALGRHVAALFENERTPTPPDVTLAAGDHGELDLTLDLPAVGTVEGSLLINGQPAPGFQVVLRSAAGVASAARLSLRSTPDSRGRFALRNVPPGDYTFQVYSTTSRQELHREAVAVAAAASVRIDALVAVGGLRGRIVSNDDASPERLDGTLTILPGATAAPADLRDYAQTHRIHTVRVRGGAFQVDHVTPGAALVIIEIRGREPSEASIDIPVRTTLETVLSAGKNR